MAAPTTSLDGLDRHHFLLGRPFVKLRRQQKWAQDQGLLTTVSGSPGLKLQHGQSLAEEPLESFQNPEKCSGDSRRVPHWFESPGPHLDWSESMGYSIIENLNGKEPWSSFQAKSMTLTDGDTVAQRSEGLCPKIIVAARHSWGRIHSHFNTSSLSSLLSHAVSLSLIPRDGSCWGNLHDHSMKIKECR